MTIEEKIVSIIGTSLNGRDLDFTVESYNTYLLRIRLYYDHQYSVADFYNTVTDDLHVFLDDLMQRLIVEADR
jgi:hypothetical protein